MTTRCTWGSRMTVYADVHYTEYVVNIDKHRVLVVAACTAQTECLSLVFDDSLHVWLENDSVFVPGGGVVVIRERLHASREIEGAV